MTRINPVSAPASRCSSASCLVGPVGCPRGQAADGSRRVGHPLADAVHAAAVRSARLPGDRVAGLVAVDLHRRRAGSGPGPGGERAGAARLESRPRRGVRARAAVRRRLPDRHADRRTAVARAGRVRRQDPAVLGGHQQQRRLPAVHQQRHPGGRQELAQGRGRAAARCRLHAARRGRRRLRLGAVAGDADVPGAVPADGAPADHRLAVRLHGAPPGAPLARRWWRTPSARSPRR